MYIVDVQLILFFWFAFTVEVQLVYRHSTLNLIRNKIITQIEHNRIENPNWQEANQLEKHSQGIDVGKTKNKFRKSEQDMNWGQLYCESNMLVAGPCIAEMMRYLSNKSTCM